MMLPTVDFCGLNVTRMIIGANPFGVRVQNSRRPDNVAALSRAQISPLPSGDGSDKSNQ